MMLYVLFTILALQGGSKTINGYEEKPPRKRLNASQKRKIISYGKTPKCEFNAFKKKSATGKLWKFECVLCNHKVKYLQLMFIQQ